MNPITLPVAELKPALMGLSKIISRRTTLPVLGHVLVQRDTDGWTTLSATRLLVAVIGIAVVLCVTATSLGGELVRDLRLSGSWRPALDLRTENAHCTRYNYLVTLCNATIVASGETGERRVETRFLMAFSSGSGEFFVPMRSSRDREAVAIGYAVEDELLNRTLTFAAAFGLLLVAAVIGGGYLATGRHRGGRAHEALSSDIAAVASAHAAQRET